ncbi:hypothetical protein AOCH_004791 [Aspergillus ochraceoroseus]|uniref:Membrane fusion mating protein FIG1 n=1 Tax=Aspergillus ochraceoroseus TaxID=138278 RepID=A0A0F8UY30_9EURO|nr:hypothetical protein AOCH_004791 [Aspergillus ochraceoroseus]
MIGYHHVLMIIIALIIILLSLLLAGCSSSSPQIPNIFLISLYYQHYDPVFNLAQVDPGVVTATANIVRGAQMEVRVGYFGICVQPDSGSYICNANATALAEIVTVDEDPLNLIWVASTFKDAVVFPYLIIIAVILSFFCFILLATFPGWHEHLDPEGSEVEIKAFPSRPVSQHTASVAASTIAQDLGNGSVKSGVGTSAMVLGWFAFALMVIVTIGLLLMILSLRLLNQLTDDGP